MKFKLFNICNHAFALEEWNRGLGRIVSLFLQEHKAVYISVILSLILLPQQSSPTEVSWRMNLNPGLLSPSYYTVLTIIQLQNTDLECSLRPHPVAFWAKKDKQAIQTSS